MSYKNSSQTRPKRTSSSRIKNTRSNRPFRPDSGPPKIVLFNKPFNTLCQFTGESGDSTLADFLKIPGVYAAGRLDKDSEGLLILTNNGGIQHKLSHPKFKKWKTYWVQVEGEITKDAIALLKSGVELKDGRTKPAKARELLPEQGPESLWKRNPPVRYRANIPTSWIELSINEGKNRQVRRMTASVGYPTLRLIRVAVDKWNIETLQPGEFKIIELD